MDGRLAVNLFDWWCVFHWSIKLNLVNCVGIISLRGIKAVRLVLLLVRVEKVVKAIIVLLLVIITLIVMINDWNILLLIMASDRRSMVLVGRSGIVFNVTTTEVEVIKTCCHGMQLLIQEAIIKAGVVMILVSFSSHLLFTSWLMAIAVSVTVVAHVVVNLVLVIVVSIVLFGPLLIRTIDKNGWRVLDIDITCVIAENFLAIVC